MPSFEIRYGEAGFDIDHLSHFQYFDVRCGGAEARVGVGLSELVRRRWELDSRADGDDVQRKVALHYLKDHLASVAALSLHRVLLTPRDHPDVGEGWTVYRLPEACPYEWKECGYRAGKQGEYYCSVAEQPDDWAQKTTLAICQDCGLPSTDIVCSNLVHPSTRSSRSIGLPWTRELWDAHCEHGHSVDGRSAAECIAGGRDCWMQTYEPEKPAPPTVPAVPQFSIADAIDQVNTAFRKRYGRRLIEIEHARSIEDLMGECATDEAFQHKLQVAAGLLEGMQLLGLLTDEEAEGSQGTIDLLARLSTRDFATLPEHYVRNLRNVNKLAAGYPRHAKVKNIERAHAELGLVYPVTDYGQAWAIIRETFVQTLRQLALHLG